MPLLKLKKGFDKTALTDLLAKAPGGADAALEEIKRLNPGLNLLALKGGETIVVPAALPPPDEGEPATAANAFARFRKDVDDAFDGVIAQARASLRAAEADRNALDKHAAFTALTKKKGELARLAAAVAKRHKEAAEEEKAYLEELQRVQAAAREEIDALQKLSR